MPALRKVWQHGRLPRYPSTPGGGTSLVPLRARVDDGFVEAPLTARMREQANRQGSWSSIDRR